MRGILFWVLFHIMVISISGQEIKFMIYNGTNPINMPAKEKISAQNFVASFIHVPPSSYCHAWHKKKGQSHDSPFPTTN
jgi:hypothetical protein